MLKNQEQWVFIQKRNGKIIDVMSFGSLKELYNQKSEIIFGDDVTGSYSRLWYIATSCVKNIKKKDFYEKDTFLIQKTTLHRAKKAITFYKNIK